MARGRLGLLVVAAASLAWGGSAAAQATPQERAREAAAMIAAAGFRIQGNQILNGCGRPSQPRPSAIDMNGDGRPEAVITDVDPVCYGPAGQQFWVIQKRGPASWTLLGGGEGRFKALETRTAGWRDYTVEGPGCQRTWTWQGAQGYLSLKACPAEGGARPDAAPSTAASGGAADRAAAFRAAGFAPTRGKYLACDRSQELQIEIRDLNGDGRPDAMITDSGLECFGNTGQGYVLVTKEPSGAWRKLFQSPGIPDFLTTRGVGGWPDIVNGGPGFCFPVMRWNGSDYAIVRWKAEQPGACAGRR